MSSGEAETNMLTIATMSVARIRTVYNEIVHGCPHRPLTVPIFTDSAAAEAIAKNKKGTFRTRHIA